MTGRTLARRPPEIHSLRSRHSRAAASAPASLPALTVPRRVRLGRAPRRTGRIDPLGARPLQERTSGCRGAPLSNGRNLRPLAAVPLAANLTSLHRPLRGTPRIASGPRLRCRGLRRSLSLVPSQQDATGVALTQRGAARFVANAPACEALIRSAALEGVFASSLDVRYTRTSALALPPRKAPLTPLLRLLRAVDLANGGAGAGSPP
ncbi:MAG: hypothetical protein XU12_C0007G0056 [Deltaproteobacteria bacterium CSP1-8]|nr:MAG: hypothetical protein XU12_C0007G0056 [Deltaproteobacteria bacterium CSP1-8]